MDTKKRKHLHWAALAKENACSFFISYKVATQTQLSSTLCHVPQLVKQAFTRRVKPGQPAYSVY